MATWQQNPDLMARLIECQNHPKFEGQDIVSFAGMCSSRDELLIHLYACLDRRDEDEFAHIGIAA